MVTTILKPVVFVIGQTIDILENYFPKIFLINLYITEAVVPGLMSGWCLGDVLLTTEGSGESIEVKTAQLSSASVRPVKVIRLAQSDLGQRCR